jgi:DHA1 family multidrug resistance protein-like MFS transporter
VPRGLLKMRASSDTDRTHVATRTNSFDHLDPLTEKNSDMEPFRIPPAAKESAPKRRQSEGRFDKFDVPEGDTTNNSSESDIDEKDLEKGNEDAEIRRAEESKKKEQKEKDPNLIEWGGPDDPENPMNWPAKKKWIVTVTLGLMTFCVTFASSVFSNATVPVAERYGVSTEVTTLGTSLFVLGFGFGPLVSTVL